MSRKFSWLKVWGVYTLVALLVLAPMLGRGYILTLDMVFAPHLRMPTSVGNGYLFRAFLHGLNYALPSDIIQKIMLLAIFVLAGVGMHRLYKQTTIFKFQKSNSKLQSAKPLPTSSYQLPATIPAFFAGILYMINPFTYDRLMAGQYNVLMGYSLFPFFVRSLLIYLQKPDAKQAVLLAVWAIAISLVSIHAIGMMALVALVAAGVTAWQHREDTAWLKRAGKFGMLSLGIFLLASSYWMVPLAIGHGSTATTIDNISATDRAAFATVGGSPLGRLGNVLHLQGFWAEDTGMYLLPQDVSPLFGLLTAAVLLLVIVGIVSFRRNRQRYLLAVFGGSTLIAIVFAVGTLNGWLAAHVPLFAGYREPQKFVVLVALGFAVFAGQGVATVIQYWRERGGHVMFGLASVTLLCVPLVWTSVMLWGCQNQLAPAQYPAEWFTVNSRLDADRSNFKVLFLPWHQYMSFDFEGRIIASPAAQFFDKPTIVSNNPEFDSIPSAPNKTANSIGTILAAARKNNNLAAKLAPFHVKYIVLARGDDYEKYGYLDTQPGLKPIIKSATMDVYQVEGVTGK